jgi:hypothetical protein
MPEPCYEQIALVPAGEIGSGTPPIGGALVFGRELFEEWCAILRRQGASTAPSPATVPTPSC